MFALGSKILGTTKQIVWIYRRFSVVLKVSKVVKWSCIFVRSIRGLSNFLVIPIMNPLARVHDTEGNQGKTEKLADKTLANNKH